jgi:ABC-type uncharacterized transport system permease subunit
VEWWLLRRDVSRRVGVVALGGMTGVKLWTAAVLAGLAATGLRLVPWDGLFGAVVMPIAFGGVYVALTLILRAEPAVAMLSRVRRR